jgi:hypothetical protein
MRRLVILIISAVLFIGAIIGVMLGFSVPAEKQETETQLTYELTGSFEHEAYGIELPKPEDNPKYFMKLIDSIDMRYSYRFLAEAPTTSVTEMIEISALVGTGLWQKEIILIPATEKKGDFTVNFSITPAEFTDLATRINRELGIGGSPKVLIQAKVNTIAETSQGTVTDEFVQVASIATTPTILEWQSELVETELGYSQGMRYEHEGSFAYTIPYRPSELFGSLTINSLPPQSSLPIPLEPADSYDLESIEYINGTFTYSFQGEPPPSSVNNDVEIFAVLSGAGWEETFTLVPRMEENENFSLTFPIDVPFLYAVIESKEGTATGTHALRLNAVVRTSARSEFGDIKETATANLTARLGSEAITWPAEPPSVNKEGTIKETVMVENSSAGIAKMGTLGALGVTLVILLYSMWRYWEYRRGWISRMDADASRVKARHSDSVVDVEAFPDLGTNGTVVELDSLEELTKLADSLLRPVIRVTEPQSQLYCVLDGSVRYQYLTTAELIKRSEYE